MTTLTVEELMACDEWEEVAKYRPYGMEEEELTEKILKNTHQMEASKACDLLGAFSWDLTPEGFQFWSKIYYKSNPCQLVKSRLAGNRPTAAIMDDIVTDNRIGVNDQINFANLPKRLRDW